MRASELTFLVAEDHDFQRKALVRMLHGLGAATVLEAIDGKEALGAFTDRDRGVHIIICDLEMPEMDGMEFIRRIGETDRPVSMILVSALDHSLIASVERMATAYGIHLLGGIKKPVTPQKLAELIGCYQGIQQTGTTPVEQLPPTKLPTASMPTRWSRSCSPRSICRPAK